MTMQTPTKRIIGSLVVAILLGTLAWIDGTCLQESGQIIIGRDRLILESTPALSFVFITAVGALGCALYAARQARSIAPSRADRLPKDRE